MDPQSFSIIPSPIMINKFRIARIHIIPLQNSANINVELLSTNVNGESEFVKTVSLQITGDDYVAWTSDSPYLINWVCSKLNFTLN